jgi:response regulator RpfG family c-di-GMP phosphodiesterase
LADASEIIYTHHEKYDGTGYPRGLKGQAVPLGARVVAIVNTLNSITSDQPYRPAQSLRAAREEIQTWSGRQFAPEIVKVVLEMPDKTWQDLRREIDGQAFKITANE